MRSLKKGVLALVLTAAALASTAGMAQASWCPRGMTYCECQGYVHCAYDCWMACEP